MGFYNQARDGQKKFVIEMPARITIGGLRRVVFESRIHALDPAFELVHTLLRSLPQVRLIDASAYVTDVPLNPLMNLVGSLATLETAQHDFSRLEELRLSCKSFPPGRLWPLFTLANLKVLSLRDVQLPPVDPKESGNWRTLGRSSPVIRLELQEVQAVLAQLQAQDLEPLILIFKACGQLESLTVTSTPLALTQILLSTYQRHFTTLKSLAVHEAGSLTQVQVGIPTAEEQVVRLTSPMCGL